MCICVNLIGDCRKWKNFFFSNRNLAGLEWLFINENDLSSLDGELPEMIPNSKLALLDVSYNRLERLPQELRHFQALNVLFAHDNQITALNGALSKNRRLERLHLDKNNLTTVRGMYETVTQEIIISMSVWFKQLNPDLVMNKVFPRISFC